LAILKEATQNAKAKLAEQHQRRDLTRDDLIVYVDDLGTRNRKKVMALQVKLEQKYCSRESARDQTKYQERIQELADRQEVISRVLRDLKSKVVNKELARVRATEEEQNSFFKQYLRQLTKRQFYKKIDLDLQSDEECDPDPAESLRHQSKRMFDTLCRGRSETEMAGYKPYTAQSTQQIRNRLKAKPMPTEIRELLELKRNGHIEHGQQLLANPGYGIYDPFQA
jgi:hypothetical protein